MRLLVTGGCGFVGSNFVRYVLQHYGPEMITNVDALTTGRLVNLDGIAASYGERYEFFHADFADEDKMNAALEKHQFFAVVHFAVESSGGAGLAALLEGARRHGVRRFLLVSKHRPDAVLADAEKAALAAYQEHGQEIVITRSSDNYGPFQSPTEFVPKLIVHALRNEALKLPSDGLWVRDWLHVEDHCAALFAVLLDGAPGGCYGLVSGAACRDIELAYRVLEHLGKGRDFVEFHGPSTPDDLCAHMEMAKPLPLTWKSRYDLVRGLRETIEWYVRNREWWEPLATR
jgi:dTDP-glucose 4,6-dehydratase